MTEITTATNHWRKKPVEVEARQFVGTNAELHAIYQWVESNTQGSFDPLSAEVPASGVSIDPATGFMLIATLEGVMQAKVGDYIIRGIQGEFYPCKPDIFEQTYEPADRPAQPTVLPSVESVIEVLDIHRWQTMGVTSVQCECGEIIRGDSSLTAFPADQAFREHIAQAILALIGGRTEREVLAQGWDEGHRHRWRRGPDDCFCGAWGSIECACGKYGTGELLSLTDNPYRSEANCG